MKSQRCALKAAAMLMLAAIPNGFAQTVNTLEGILLAHGAGLGPPPVSVEMTGTVERKGASEPFRIIATRDEELRVEYGTEGRDTRVTSQKLNFRDDGQKFSYEQVPSGFAQLDITGLFLIQQLRQRAVRVEATGERTTIGATSVQRLRVGSERTQVHKGGLRVADSLDVYVTDAGLLAGVSRSFYEGRPEGYTLAYALSDYRQTEGILLPHRIEVFMKARKVETYVIGSYRFDTRPDRELFLSRRVR